MNNYDYLDLRKAKKLIVIFVFLGSALLVKGQGLEFGIKGGFNYGTPYGVADEGATGILGLGPAVGLYFRAQLNMKWKVQAEFLYSRKSSTFKNPFKGDTIYEVKDEENPYKVHTHYDGWVEGEFDNVYLDIPVIFMYVLSERWMLTIGPQFSYLLKGKNTGTADFIIGDPNNPFDTIPNYPIDQSSELNKWDYGIMVGSVYNISKRFYTSLSVTTGLISVYNSSYAEVDRIYRNIYLQAALGFKVSKD